MRDEVVKKIRKAARKNAEKTKEEVYKALLSIKSWPFARRWQFCKWLLFGKGQWGGVK
jgi:hypothetical protein